MNDTTNTEATTSDETPASEEATTQAAQPAQDTPQAATETTPPEQDDTPSDNLPNDPQTLKNMIHKLRAENAKQRTDAKTQAANDARNEIIEQIGQTLGLTTTNTNQPPTVEELTATLTQAQADTRTAQTELAVYKAANGKADPDALLDSQAFRHHINGIDTNDQTALAAAIDTFITNNPRFKPAQAAGATAIEHPAGSGETGITLDDFKRMNGEQRNTLYATDPGLYRKLAAQA